MKPAKLMKRPIDPHHRRTLIPIAQHEVGHYIAARVLGFKTGAISLVVFDFTGAHRGGAEIIPCCGLRDVRSIDDYLERRITVLYSGALAESLSKGQVDNNYAINAMRHGGSQNDYAKARELIQTLRNIRFPDTITEEEVQKNLDVIGNQLWNKAAGIVLAESAIIEGLGDRLAGDIKYTNELVTLSDEELEALPIIRDRFGSPAPADTGSTP
jgi:hypothetical protein